MQRAKKAVMLRVTGIQIVLGKAFKALGLFQGFEWFSSQTVRLLQPRRMLLAQWVLRSLAAVARTPKV